MGDILLALRTQLMTTTGLPVERCRIVATWPPPDQQPVGDQDLNIRPLGFIVPPLEGPNGAGRLETILHRQVGVMVRTRLSVDYEETADAWLTDGTLGHLALEEMVFDSLQNFLPVNTNQDILTACPIQLVSGEPPDKKEEDLGHGREIILFDVPYMPPINANIL